MQSLRLILPLDFLASTYAPSICLLSGKTAPTAVVERIPVVVVASNRGNGQAIKLVVPATRSAARYRRLVDVLPFLAVLLVGMVVSGLTCAVFAYFRDLREWVTSNDDSRRYLKYPLIAIFLGVVGGATWLINRWIKSRFVTLSITGDPHSVAVNFPNNMAATHQVYEDALKTWKKAGSPRPVPLSKKQEPGKEDWVDNVKAGWDQPQ